MVFTRISMGIFMGELLVYQRVSNDFFWAIFIALIFGSWYIYILKNIYWFVTPSLVPLVWNFISNFRFGTNWQVKLASRWHVRKVQGPQGVAKSGKHCMLRWQRGGLMGTLGVVMYFLYVLRFFFCLVQLWLWFGDIFTVSLTFTQRYCRCLRYFSVFHFEGNNLEFQGLGRCWLMSSKVLCPYPKLRDPNVLVEWQAVSWTVFGPLGK